MFAYDLAAMLHKSVAEIMDMTMDEFAGWVAWAKIRNTNGK
jgi:hypothetical protein